MERNKYQTEGSNRFPVRKVVLACSYNDTENRQETIDTQIENERKSGKEPTYLILRDEKEPFFLKFNIPLFISGSDGRKYSVPLFLFPLYDVYKAEFERTSIIGHEDIGKIFDKFSDFFGVNKRVEFADEGPLEGCSYSNTMKRAMKSLQPEPDDVCLLLPGDLPIINTKAFRYDKDVKDHDLVVELNTLGLTGQHFPKNYHFTVRYRSDTVKYAKQVIPYESIDEMLRGFSFNGSKGKIAIPSKEANPWLMNFYKIINDSRIGASIYDIAYAGRKAYSKKGAGSQTTMLIETLFKDNGKFSLKRIAHFLNILKDKDDKELRHVLFSVLPEKILNLERLDNLANLDVETTERLFEHILSNEQTKIRTKVKPSPQPGGVLDCDSIQDIVFVQAMLDKDSTVYPHAEEFAEFGRCVENKWGVEFTDSWIERANEIFEKYKFDAHYRKDGTIEQGMFPEESIEKEIGMFKFYFNKMK
tara:strand:+ start:953 stop:2374 length:1422 start_codon:yes stop_codon:yes gene_type:complete